jgi:exopolysaccharide biosynthesis polyprenyl glycosylphosphotransferase
MTLTADRGEASSAPNEDRRSPAHEPRRSWASSQPFVARPTPFNRPEIREGRWTSASRRYRAVVLCSDVVVAAAVGVGVTFALGYAYSTVALWLAGAVVSFVLAIAVARGYERRRLGVGVEEYQSVLMAGVLVAIGLVVVAFTFQVDIPRLGVFLGVPLATALACAGRHALRKRLHKRRVHGQDLQRTIVVGDPATASRVAMDLTEAAFEGYMVVGLCLASAHDEAPLSDLPVLGAVADIAQVVVDHAVEIVVVTGSILSGDALRRLSWALDRAGASLVVVPDLVDVSGPRITVRPNTSLALLEVEVAAPKQRLVAKNMVDKVLAPVLVLVSLPLIAMLALLIRATSPGPAFYRHERIGIDGRPFTMWKLRTMYTDADRRRTDLMSGSDGNGILFKLRDDPRVTPVGRVLRRFSLDELPQLWNVMRGDMALVGPRPPLASEVVMYEDEVHRRLRVKPGLTGLWQVSGRSDLTWEDTVRLDLRYADNWSLVMDLSILWKTLRAVVHPRGAY